LLRALRRSATSCLFEQHQQLCAEAFYSFFWCIWLTEIGDGGRLRWGSALAHGALEWLILAVDPTSNISTEVLARHQPWILFVLLRKGGPKFLNLGEQQYFVWDTASQRTK